MVRGRAGAGRHSRRGREAGAALTGEAVLLDAPAGKATLEEARARFRDAFGGVPESWGVAPGRVNLIGEHVDYLGGLVLPAAVDRYLAVASRPASGWALSSAGGSDTAYLPALGEELAVEPQAVAVSSDIPPEAGLSSSAALLVALARAWRPELSGDQAALAAQRAERRATGVQVGIMDQFAAALGEPDHVLLLNCASLAYRPVPFPRRLLFAVLDSGVRRRLQDTPYNQRRREALAAVAASGVPVLELQTGGADPRLRHVSSELARVRAMVKALEAGDDGLVGRLLNESHASLRDDFQVSTPAVDQVVTRAQQAPGCLGARVMGAGFGGSVLAVVEADAETAFAGHIGQPVIFCRPAAGAFWTAA